jgi:hypothetical protein
MFEILAGTEVRVIKDGREWRGENIRSWITRKDNLFDKAELCVDPTGIATWASVPGGVTIGSAFAEAGYYGFRSEGYTVLVHASKCAYLD